ncbi:transcription factor ETV6 [Achroia grisella]|uniref:transcription factor ETV6 n=1 Tax=Achroia grisella TaxID=688607 RepID=UPI0027D302AD|nr:transcription factor ETV6 [Achroia grisella]
MTFECGSEKTALRARCDRVPPSEPGDWAASALHLAGLAALHHDDLPLDPRSWGRGEVGRWVSRRGGLPERFPMNGKALCLMTQEMFASRVPHTGHLLYQDFRKRLSKALALQDLFEKISPK